MDGQKTRKSDVARKAPVKVQTELWPDVQVLDSELGDIAELGIDENSRLAAIHTTPRASTSLSRWKKTSTE